MQFKLFFIFLILNTYFLIFNTNPVSAHVVKSDNKVGAVMHIDPSDEPIAGGNNIIILEFKDLENKFNLEECECKLIIISGEKQFIENSLTSATNDEKLVAKTEFIFPDPGNYQVKVSGEPKQGNSFADFEFSYDITVSSKPSALPIIQSLEKQPGNWFRDHIIHLAGAFVILGFFIFALIKQSIKK